MGNVCGKQASKRDFFKKVNAARMYRRGLFSKYRVKLNKRGSPRFCHTWGRHGSTRSVEWQRKRMMGLLKAQGVPQTQTPSWFHDKQAEMYAREKFLEQHKDEMDRIARAIDNGDKKMRPQIDGVISTREVIGVGIDSRNSQLEMHVSIREAYFNYEYENKAWHERTGYPSIDAHLKNRS
jgi:hypothetical protein